LSKVLDILFDVYVYIVIQNGLQYNAHLADVYQLFKMTITNRVNIHGLEFKLGRYNIIFQPRYSLFVLCLHFLVLKSKKFINTGFALIFHLVMCIMIFREMACHVLEVIYGRMSGMCDTWKYENVRCISHKVRERS